MIDSVKGVSFNPSTCKRYQDGSEKKLKKQQMISQVEGEFYCTYLVDETGKKILISKIPISQVEKEEICLNGSVFENIKNVICHNIKNR